MANLSKLDYQGKYNHASTGLFKDNTANDIGADDVRTLVTDTSDSFLNKTDDAYTAIFPQVTASGTDTYTATLSPEITAYVLGQKFQILFTNANTGPSTANLGPSALAITKNGATALAAGDIPAGSIKILAYDGTRLQIIGDGGVSGSGTVESVTGDGVDNTDPDNPVLSFPTLTDLGLENVDNTSDADKPVSTATQAALDLKANITDVVGVQDLFIPASAMWPRVTSGCSVLTQYEMTTSLFNIQGLEFSDTVQQFAQFQITLPRKWNNSTITAVVYWKPLVSGTGDVQWGISAGAYSNDDALTVALGTAQTVDDTFIATDDLHVTAATAAITVAGTPADADFLALQISRNPGSDTLDVNAVLLGISIRITTDSAIDA